MHDEPKKPETVINYLTFTVTHCWLVTWHSGRTSVCDRWTFPVGLQLQGEHLCG